MENYISAVKKRNQVIIHSLLPIDDLVKLIDALVDTKHEFITELSSTEYNDLFMNTDCIVYHIDRQTFDVVIKGIRNKK